MRCSGRRHGFYIVVALALWAIYFCRLQVLDFGREEPEAASSAASSAGISAESILRSSQVWCTSHPVTRACVFKNLFAWDNHLHFVRFESTLDDDFSLPQPQHCKGFCSQDFRHVEINSYADLANLFWNDKGVKTDPGEGILISALYPTPLHSYGPYGPPLFDRFRHPSDLVGMPLGNVQFLVKEPGQAFISESLERLVFYTGTTLAGTIWAPCGNLGHALFDGVWPSYAAWYRYLEETHDDAFRTATTTPVNMLSAAWFDVKRIFTKGFRDHLEVGMIALRALLHLDPGQSALCNPSLKMSAGYTGSTNVNFMTHSAIAWLWQQIGRVCNSLWSDFSVRPGSGVSVFETFVMGNARDSLMRIHDEYKLSGPSNAMRALRQRFYNGIYTPKCSHGPGNAQTPESFQSRGEGGNKSYSFRDHTLETCSSRMQEVLAGKKDLRLRVFPNKRTNVVEKSRLMAALEWLTEVQQRADSKQYAGGEGGMEVLADTLTHHYEERQRAREKCVLLELKKPRQSAPAPRWQDESVSCAVQLVKGGDDLDYSLINNYTEHELRLLLVGIIQATWKSGMTLRINATYDDFPPAKQQVEMMADTDIFVVGVGTSMMNSFLLRDGALMISLGSWNGNAHRENCRSPRPFSASYARGQRPWLGEMYLHNAMSSHLQVYSIRRSPERPSIEHLPFLRAIMKSLMRILFAKEKKLGPLKRASLSISPGAGFCGDLGKSFPDESMPPEALLWKKMCLVDDPDGCYEVMKSLNKASATWLEKAKDPNCFWSHWIEQLWWTRKHLEGNCAQLSKNTLEYLEEASRSHGMRYVPPENCEANQLPSPQ
eukprot:TRINITY_DN25875_c0_g1_i1.p1 TRINITY_DN25875_c0_g1~~TRINITY_DN25875_c0_g1_i1.p1  ORF type:complete len:828 (+),score=108.01 TRINITY_DN25875_c0_g1_i1:10-2493(+)